MALEAEFWAVIDAAVSAENRSLASLIAEIDDTRDPDDPLSSSIRVWVLNRAQTRAERQA